MIGKKMIIICEYWIIMNRMTLRCGLTKLYAVLKHYSYQGIAGRM